MVFSHTLKTIFYLIICLLFNQILSTPIYLLFYDPRNHIPLCLFVLVCSMYILFQPQKTILYNVGLRKTRLSVTCCLSIFFLFFSDKTCSTELNVSGKHDDNTQYVSLRVHFVLLWQDMFDRAKRVRQK